MSPLNISIKNAGTVYEIILEETDSGLELKQKIQDLTQIPIIRQKILVKGGKIEDEAILSELNLNWTQPIMVLGTTDKNLPSKPDKKPVFLEDLPNKGVANDSAGVVQSISNTCEFKAALKHKGLVVVDFFATWCGPCKMIAPLLQKFSEQYPEAKFLKVDVDENRAISQEYEVTSMPTILFFKDGQVVKKIVGANPGGIKAAILGNI